MSNQNNRVLTRKGARELTSKELAQVSGGLAGTACQLTGSPRTFQDIICDCPGC
jgi:bacteriocin-like protein